MIAALPPAIENADHGNWWDDIKLGPRVAHRARRDGRLRRRPGGPLHPPGDLPVVVRRPRTRRDRGDLLDSVTHGKTIGRQCRGEVEIQSSQSYNECAGPMDRPVLYLHDVEDGIEDPEEVRFLGAVLPRAAEVLAAALAEWDHVTGGA